MVEETNLILSDKELSLVTNAEWILTKHAITQKVFDLFAANTKAIDKQITGNQYLPAEIKSTSPKIFKGENYLQLPYVIMDYPRLFDKENIFAVRTMFWWGNFFSITLHLSGIYKSLVKDLFCGEQDKDLQEIYIGVNEDQWQHHFRENNFLSYADLSAGRRMTLFSENDFVKLALKFNLEEWNSMPVLLAEGYKKLGSLLNSPGGEKDLLPGIPTTGFDP